MWISLTADAFADALLPAEKTALDGVKARPGTTAAELLDRTLRRVANDVRGYCPAETPRGDGITIPEELELAALALARQACFTALPRLQGLWTDARQQDYLQALAKLRLWADGKYSVAPPETAAPAAQQAAAPVKNLGPRRQPSGGLI